MGLRSLGLALSSCRLRPSQGQAPAGIHDLTFVRTANSILTSATPPRDTPAAPAAGPSVAASRYGFEFWGIRTRNLIDTQARMLHWAVTGRPGPDGPI